jgi:hypothetical protein
MASLIDPRLGDVEDDASSTKRRSLFGIAGSLLAEISLPKLVVAWLLLIAVPGVLLGLAPLVVSAWLSKLSRTITEPASWIWVLPVLAIVIAIGWLGGWRLLRLVEQAFWSLNSLAIQPGYALCRETLRHLSTRLPTPASNVARRNRLQAASAAGAGLIVCAFALIAVGIAWPCTRWVGILADFIAPHRLIAPALANTVVIVGCYSAGAALLWGIADAAMHQPQDLTDFDSPPLAGETWRIAQLSDIHVVGERYGFRIESGRSGPQGNERLARVLARLDAIHAEEPLDLVLFTGDMTDAGLSTEWAEFLSALARYPRLQERSLILPGNHDLNVVDRTNPARLELPTSPRMRLRQMRALSAIVALQGDRARMVGAKTRRLGDTLTATLAPHREAIATFADTGARHLSARLAPVWADAFPMVLPPTSPGGLGVILLNSVAPTHFSFTNALGLVSAEQSWKLAAVAEEFPDAHWVVALHHHLVEYPKPAKALSERIGTALINGSWFVRQLLPFRERIVVLHGHRHIDWVGECGGLRIISAPSPVMEATNSEPTCFHILRMAAGPGGRLSLLAPLQVNVPGDGSAEPGLG